VEGFDTVIASKINRGSVLNGNIYVDPAVTPFLNTVRGPMSENEISVATGNNVTYNQTT